jgi:hypothetical protein
MYELKIRTTLRLVNRIKTLASERKISINKMAVYLLELGVYRLFEEEKEYGKIKHRQVDSK